MCVESEVIILTTSVAAPSSTSGGSSQTRTGNGNASSNSTPSSNAAAAANSLKSGPQVLIKNINGKLTITPVPGTETENAAEMVQQQQQTPAVESIPHKNSSSKQTQQQEQKVQLPQSNSSLMQNKYGAIRKVVNTQIKMEQVQLDPTQYGAIRKVLNTKTKKDQNQQNCNQYGFIRNVRIFYSIGCFLNSQHVSQPKKDRFLNFPENITCIYFKKKIKSKV